jgi:N-carbamoyl-L-amino-acid hydrolase
MRFEPGAFNIIPGKVEVSVEFRAPETNLLDNLEAALVRQASVESEKFGLEVSSEWLGRGEPVRMSEIAQFSIKEASDALRFSSVSLTSGAGHDANSFAPECPTGMIFIPSVDGFSHSPYEYSNWDDCVNGANVLLQSAIRMAYEVSGRQS